MEKPKPTPEGIVSAIRTLFNEYVMRDGMTMFGAWDRIEYDFEEVLDDFPEFIPLALDTLTDLVKGHTS